MSKLVYIVLDGVNANWGWKYLGYINHLMEQNLGGAYTVRAELPTMSRPLYETLQSGLVVWEHGIVTNDTVRPSKTENLFKRAKRAGLVTAAAAYHWVCELYDTCPFDPMKHRYRLEGKKEGDIDHGIYYWTDDYPVEYTFNDADYLIEHYEPDYILVHPMNADNAGHLYGGESVEYGRNIMASDVCLAKYLPRWIEAGYQIVVTADHGMNAMGYHVGPSEEERLVPLFVMGDGIKCGDFRAEIISQLELAPLCARLLNIEPMRKGGECFFA